MLFRSINKAEEMMADHLQKAVEALYDSAFRVMLSALLNNMYVFNVAKDIATEETITFKDTIVNYFDFQFQLNKIDERIDMYNWCQSVLTHIENT